MESKYNKSTTTYIYVVHLLQQNISQAFGIQPHEEINQIDKKAGQGICFKEQRE